MGFMAELSGRKAYTTHVKGNRFIEAGHAEMGKKAHDQALELYEKAFQGGCKNATYLMAYGVLLMRYGKYEQAREYMLKAEKTPNMSAAEKQQLRINYSVCQWKLGNLDKAIELMESAAQVGKTSVIYTTLGYYYIEKAMQTGDFSQALAFNEEAYEYDDEDAATLDNLGELYYAMNKREEAYDYFRRAHKAKPTQVPTLYFLAKMNHEDGNDVEARKLINAAKDGNFSALCSLTHAQVDALAAEIG